MQSIDDVDNMDDIYEVETHNDTTILANGDTVFNKGTKKKITERKKVFKDRTARIILYTYITASITFLVIETILIGIDKDNDDQ